MTDRLPDLTPRAPQSRPWPPQPATYPPMAYAVPPGGPLPPAGASSGSRAGQALGWAIAAAVAAGVALLLSVVALVWALGGWNDPYADGGYLEPMRGQVPGLSDGAALSGDRLEYMLVDGIRDFGGEDVEVDCPDTRSVTTSSLIVCRGDIDGYEWTGAVFFEDSVGTFVVAEF